jgi:hypothetical protein
MTTKQASQKVSVRLRRRAETIIASDAYDQDTRNAIRNILATTPDELSEYVRRAEQGETILDIVGERERYQQAALQVEQLFNRSAAPDWLTTAMMKALNQASEVKKMKIWKEAETANGTEDFDVEALADLFAITQRFDLEFSPDTDPAWSRLANAVSEIATNAATPVGLFDPVMGFLHSESGELWGKLIRTPAMIQKILIEARVHEEVSNVAN